MILNLYVWILFGVLFRNIEFGNYQISYADPDTGEQESQVPANKKNEIEIKKEI